MGGEAEADGASSVGRGFSPTSSCHESGSKLPHSQMARPRAAPWPEGGCKMSAERKMTFVDTKKLEVIERLPGWFGRYFHSPNMTFAYYDFVKGASIHEHFHPEEEVWQVIEGELEVTIGGETRAAGPGTVAIVPAHTPHSVKALTKGKAIVADYPLREGF